MEQNTLIQLSQVKFDYAAEFELPLIDIPMWHVAVNEHVLIVGRSGSGKSTLLKLLSGIILPKQGKISVAGHALEGLNDRRRDRFRATQIGYVAQRFNLIPYLCAIDNVRLAIYFARRSKERAQELDIKALLQELDVSPRDWHKPVKHLSVGQQQRVAIARAMINKPKLIIADEPTSSLDQDSRDAFLKLLLNLVNTQKTTLVFVSHDLSLSSHFHRIEQMSLINNAKA